MENWFTVFTYELRQQLVRKAFLFTTFGIPLLGLLAFFGYNLYQDINAGKAEPEEAITDEFKNQNQIGFVDLSGTLPMPEPDSPFAAFLVGYESEAVGKAALERGEIESLFVLAEDYLETGEGIQWLPRFDITMIGSDGLMEAYILNNLDSSLDPQIITRLRYPIADLDEQRIEVTGEAKESSFGGDFVVIYAFALLLMITLYSSSGYLMNSVVQEKESKTIEILLTSVKPLGLMLGKVLAMGVVGLLTIAVWLAAILFLASQSTAADILELSAIEVKPATIVIALIYFLLGYGFMGSIFAAVGALTNTVREGSSLAGWLVFPVIIPLFVINTFVEHPNGTIPTVLSLIPFTAPLAMVMRSAISDVPLWEVLLSIALMLLLVAAGIWIASRVFRVNMLLCGTMPRLRELPGLFLRG